MLKNERPADSDRAPALETNYTATAPAGACAVRGCCWRGRCPVHAIALYPSGFRATRALMANPRHRRGGVKAVR